MARPYRLIDMHCHLDRMANALEVARDAAARDIAIFDTTVTPTDARTAAELLDGEPNVHVGVGLHPWWIADGTCGDVDVARAAELASRSAFVGEVGLDFGRRGTGTERHQIAAFEQITAAIAANPLPHRLMSIHAVQSATAVLDILERHGLMGANTDTTCIFHWFTGTSEELARARRHGCHFSVNEHMLKTKRGREYARQLPLERLLLETDAPPGLDTPYSAEALERSLITAAEGIAHVKDMPMQNVVAATTENALELLMR